jgi:putative oxidoreductase
MNKHAALVIARISIGVPMLIYGISKTQKGIGFITEMLAQKGLPPIIGYGVYVGEVVAPILILLGIRTRIAAIVFAINCTTALLLTQTPLVFELNAYGGWAIELLFMYTMIAISVAISGAGKWAICSNTKWD